MSLLRVQIDLAFPMPLSDTVKTRLDALKVEIAKAKAYATKINADKDNEEMTVSAKYHICHNDTNQPCEPEKEL
jgi:hypothetical protein